MPPARLVVYALRFAGSLATMEVLTHTIPAFAVAETAAYVDFGPLDATLFAFILLKLMWLKFLLIWRFVAQPPPTLFV
jgi:hypothetical protein